MREIYRCTIASASAVAILCMASAVANAQTVVRFDLPAQSLAESLKAVANQTSTNVLFDLEVIEGKQAPALNGELTPDAAVGRLLIGTGLTHELVNEHTIVLTPLDAKKSNISWVDGELERAAAPGSATDQLNSAVTLQEVIVTATKREERLLDVPMSVAVVGGKEVERRGAVGMQDYLRSIPSVNQIDIGALSNAVVIRGITTTPQFENFASGTTVATYFGETPITAAAGLGAGGIDVRPVDIERIEVLRGPQGTTYGSASLSGALRIIPNPPRLDRFEGRVMGDYSSTSGAGDSNTTVQGVLNLPLARDVLAIRLVGYRYDESGYHRNIAGFDPATLATADRYGQLASIAGYQQTNVGGMVSEGGRLAALWQASDELSISLNALHQTIEQNGSPVTNRGGYRQARFPVAPQGRVRGEIGEVADTDVDLANVVLNYDFSGAALTSTVSWVDGGSVIAETVNYNNSGSTTMPSKFRSWTAETRLASRPGGKLHWLGGLFYEDVESSLVQTLWWPGSEATNPFGTNPGYVYDERRDLTQQAVFGEVSYDLTQTLTATAGVRFFEYRKNERLLTEGGLYRVPYGAGIPSILGSTQDDSSYRLSLSYKPSDHAQLYAAWSDGFRLGRPAAGIRPTQCDIDQDGIVDGMSITIDSTRNIESDFVDNYEIGGKFEFLERRLVLDAAVYYIEWTGLPMRLRAPPPCSSAFTANVGDAASTGAEVQLAWMATPSLRFDIGASYGDAELTKDAPQVTPIPAFDGDRLPGSPRFSANLSAQYETTIAGYHTFFRVDSLYAGEFFGDLQQSPTLRAGNYAKADARVGISLKNVDLELFVRNVTNTDAYTWRAQLATGVAAYQVRPRTYGLYVGYRIE